MSDLSFIFCRPAIRCVCFFLCSYFNLFLLSFFFLSFFFFFPSGFPPLLCACDVCRRLRALCQRCLMKTKPCVLLFVRACWCMQIGLFGADGSCRRMFVALRPCEGPSASLPFLTLWFVVVENKIQYIQSVVCTKKV